MLLGIGTSVVVLAGAVVFLFDPATTSFYPACPFRAVTGLLCPGCGSTRALHAFLHGRIAEAFALNPLLFLAPAVIAAMQWSPHLGLDTPLVVRLRNSASWMLLLLVLGFGIARNLL